jgi:hypothetical protein
MHTAPGMSRYPITYYEDLYITENQKNDLEYLKGNIDHWVANLVQPKSELRTLRNYYNGIRDDKEFEYLTENFGIGTPSSLNFMNIIKPRIDSIVAQLESDSYTYSVSCTDDKTIDLIQEEKKEKKLREIEGALDLFSKKMKTALQNEEDPVPFSELQSSTAKIKEKYKTNFMSDFEIAAQKVCTYFEKSNDMELRLKLSVMVHDLAVTGECYYRVYFDREGSDPKFDVIKPENFFHNKNTNSPFIDGTDAVVRREYLTHKQVAAKYGKYMTADQMRELFGGTYMSRTARNLNSGLDLELYYGEDDPMLGQKHFNSAYTVEVLHVEWIATNEVIIDEEEQSRLQLINAGIKYKIGDKVRKMDRYEGTRIGGSVYVNCGKSEQVPRSNNDPYICGFSYGGLLNNDRNGKPYSIVGALKDLQDVYDLTLFHRDNLLANSGVKGNRVNIAGIPRVLGDNFMDRLFKFMALKKNGVELIDPTEQGAQLFNHYGDFDNTLDGNSIAAINGVIAQIEHQADVIAGTTPQMMGHIEEREAVDNVKVGLKQSLMINQPLFEMFRGNQNRIIKDLVNVAQLSYKRGRRISYIVGGEAYTFSIIPEKFSFTDYAIAINFASKDTVKVEQMRTIAKELIATGMLDPDVIVKALLSDSVTEISQMITKNWAKKKAENDQLGSMNQQIEQYEKQMKELQGQLSNITQQLEASKAANVDIKAKEVDLKHAEAQRKLDIEEDKRIDQKEFNEAKMEEIRERTQLEREQLYQGTGNSKEIKNL